MTTITRRAARGGLALLPAATAAAASPKPSAPATVFSGSANLQTLSEPADSPSQIAALYARWLEIYNVPAEDLPDDDAVDALCAKMVVIEDKMSAEPARDFRDFALKVAALTHFGGFAVESRHDLQRFADARRLISEAGL